MRPLFVLGDNGTTFKGESCEIEINYTKPQNKWLVYTHKLFLGREFISSNQP